MEVANVDVTCLKVTFREITQRMSHSPQGQLRISIFSGQRDSQFASSTQRSHSTFRTVLRFHRLSSTVTDSGCRRLSFRSTFHCSFCLILAKCCVFFRFWSEARKLVCLFFLRRRRLFCIRDTESHQKRFCCDFFFATP